MRRPSLCWRACVVAPQTECAPSGGFHLIGSIQPVREASTRSERVDSSRSGVTLHRAQASSRSRPTAPLPVIAGDTLMAFIGTPSGNPVPVRGLAAVREPDTTGNGGGFCSMRSLLSACRRHVAPLVMQIPLFGSGEVVIQGGEVPKSQTTSAKNVENGLSWTRWSAFWAQRCLASCTACTRTRSCKR